MKNALLSILASAALGVASSGIAGFPPDPDPTAFSDMVFIGGNPAFPPLVDGQPQFVPNFFPVNAPNGVVLFFSDPGKTILSDEIWVFNQQFNFASDPDFQNLAGIPVLGMVVETGAPQDVSAFFGLPPNFIAVQSDLPEPSAWAMLAIGAIFLLAARRVVRKRA